MIQQMSSTPHLRIYRSADRQLYTFMHFASLDPGRYVGWGVFQVLTRTEAEIGVKEVVLRSLDDFSKRDGYDISKRLKVSDEYNALLRGGYVTVKSLPSGLLQLVQRIPDLGGRNWSDGEKQELRTDISSNEFFARLDNIFP
jgi:hypothetical protein